MQHQSEELSKEELLIKIKNAKDLAEIIALSKKEAYKFFDGSELAFALQKEQQLAKQAIEQASNSIELNVLLPYIEAIGYLQITLAFKEKKAIIELDDMRSQAD